jgi:nucleoside-triphosphatase
VRGFLTEEIRRGSERVGFALETLGGSRSTLAHVDCPSPHRVGRYRVDLGALEEAAEKALAVEPDVELYLVDEIGKMECLSPRFVERVEALLDSGIPTVATIARSGTGFIERVKRRADVELWELTRYNRDGMLERILGWIAERTRS